MELKTNSQIMNLNITINNQILFNRNLSALLKMESFILAFIRNTICNCPPTRNAHEIFKRN